MPPAFVEKRPCSNTGTALSSLPHGTKGPATISKLLYFCARLMPPCVRTMCGVARPSWSRVEARGACRVRRRLFRRDQHHEHRREGRLHHARTRSPVQASTLTTRSTAHRPVGIQMEESALARCRAQSAQFLPGPKVPLSRTAFCELLESNTRSKANCPCIQVPVLRHSICSPGMKITHFAYSTPQSFCMNLSATGLPARFPLVGSGSARGHPAPPSHTHTARQALALRHDEAHPCLCPRCLGQDLVVARPLWSRNNDSVRVYQWLHLLS